MGRWSGVCVRHDPAWVLAVACGAFGGRMVTGERCFRFLVRMVSPRECCAGMRGCGVRGVSSWDHSKFMGALRSWSSPIELYMGIGC